MHYKLTHTNEVDYPKDKITQRYADVVSIMGYYVIKDKLTEQHITDYVEIVDELPSDWHEPDKNYQVMMTIEQALQLAEDVPEMAVYRKQNGIQLHKDETHRYFYVNYFEPGHREFLEQYATITENTETE